MRFTPAAAAVLAAVILAMIPRTSHAASVLQPGGTVGLALGTPLPEGVYFANTSSYGQRSATRSGLGVNLTSVLWATPLTFQDTRFQMFFLQPTNYTTNTGADAFYPNSPLLAGQLAHSFGNGFGASFFAGFRTAVPSAPAFRLSSFEQRGAISYTANGFNLTANAVNGLFYDRSTYPDWFNLDLTATKKFDRLEIGAVAFGSTDISTPFATYRRQRQVAAGGLVGYNFGRFTLQTYLTRDVFQRNYTGYDTRGFVRLVLPLYVAPVATAAPIRVRW